MTFRIKKSLLGIAAVSLLAPMASHSQLAGKGPWISDSTNNAVRDGRGSTCVSAGGSDHGFDNAYCSGAAADSKAAVEASAAAAKAAAAEQAAAAQAAREEALMAVEPGSGLKPGMRGYYAHDSSGAVVRDGAGSGCVRDSRWSVAYATEECDPELFELWRKRQAATGQLAPRLQAAPPLRETGLEPLDTGPGAAPAPGPSAVEAPPVTGDNSNAFPITTYDGGGAALANDRIPDDDKVMPEDEAAEEAMAQDDAEEEETVVMAGAEPQPAPVAPAPAAPVRAPVTPPAVDKGPVKPTSLPVTVRTDGLFGFDRFDLRAELVLKLDGVVDMLNGAKYDRISVVGYTDPIGTAAYNRKLSQRRAEAVKKYLVSKGIDPGRIATSGKGESGLVVTRADCKGKRKKSLIACLEPNRRVVIDAAGEKPVK